MIKTLSEQLLADKALTKPKLTSVEKKGSRSSDVDE